MLKTLADAVHKHRLLVIRGQRMTRDQYLEFGRWWGEPIPHVLDHLRMRGYPEMMAIGNYGGEWKDNAACAQRRRVLAYRPVLRGGSVECDDALLDQVPGERRRDAARGLEARVRRAPGGDEAASRGPLRPHLYGAGSGRETRRSRIPSSPTSRWSGSPPFGTLIVRPPRRHRPQDPLRGGRHALRDRGDGRGSRRDDIEGAQAACAPGAVHLPAQVPGRGHRDLRHHADPALGNADRACEGRSQYPPCCGAISVRGKPRAYH